MGKRYSNFVTDELKEILEKLNDNNKVIGTINIITAAKRRSEEGNFNFQFFIVYRLESTYIFAFSYVQSRKQCNSAYVIIVTG